MNLPEIPLPQQRQETYQALYYEPPGVPEQWQYIASPAVHQDGWIRPELYQTVPWVPYVDTGGCEEEWAEGEYGQRPCGPAVDLTPFSER